MKKHGYLIALLVMVISLLIAAFISLILMKPVKKQSKNTKKENKIQTKKTYEELLDYLYSDCTININDYLNLDKMSNETKINTTILNMDFEEIKVDNNDEIDMTGCTKDGNEIISSNYVILDTSNLSEGNLFFSESRVEKEAKEIFGKDTIINHQTTKDVFYDKTAHAYILPGHGCDNYNYDWFQTIYNTKKENNKLYIDVVVGSLIDLTTESKTKICNDYKSDECILLSDLDKKYHIEEDKDHQFVNYEQYALDNKDKFAKYRYTFEKEDSNYVIKKLEKITNSNDLFYIQKGNEYKVSSDDVNISFSYPLINSKTESVTKINDEIKNLYTKQEKNVLYNPSKDDDCTCIIVDGKEKCGRSVNGYNYDIIETNTILNIKINELIIKSCGSGSSELTKSYFISKNTKKALTNSEILKEFKYEDNKLIEAYNTYLEELKTKHKDVFDEYKNIKSIDELTLILIKDNNTIKLGVSGPGYGNGIKFDLVFDGSKIIGFDDDEIE